MKRVAIFGNAGGGKSTLARKLAELTRLPLYSVDMLQYRPGGAAVPHDEYFTAHAQLLQRDEWILDGFGCVRPEEAALTHRLFAAAIASHEHGTFVAPEV